MKSSSKVTPEKLRSFGYIVGAAFVLLGAIFLWRGWSREQVLLPGVLLGIGLTLAVLGFLAPAVLIHAYRPWMGLAHYMGTAMTCVIMTVFYFTILVPFTLIRFKDPLKVRLGADSYWEPYRNEEPTLERFRRPF
jgi:hypothetical protein